MKCVYSCTYWALVLGLAALSLMATPAAANQCCDIAAGCISSPQGIDEDGCEGVHVNGNFFDNHFCDINTGDCAPKPGGDAEDICSAGVSVVECSVALGNGVPATSEWGLLIMGLVLTTGGTLVIMNRPRLVR